MSKRAIRVLMSTLACWTCLPSAMAREEPPSWAYPMNPPGFKLTPDDGAPRHVPDSRVKHTLSEVRDRFLAPDWHPDAHPPMPAVVARGRPQNVSACGYCHRAEGTGGPENSSLAGLSAPYILQQLADYKSGARSTAVPNRGPQTLMIATAKALTEEEAKAAAAYFSALKPRQNIQVVESKTVPKTYVYNWFLAPAKPSAREPIGQRIIELNNDLERFENRDPRVTFTAYVPPGSIQRGQALVLGKKPEKTMACASCHGQDMRGTGIFPSIAGRSPTYIFRQLYELQTGVRAGPSAALMKAPLASLQQSDMIDIAAYLGTLKP